MTQHDIKSKKRAGFHLDADEHDDEAWIVSYADMVTLLFGFFVILYSFSNLDEKKFDQISEKMAEAFKADSIANSGSTAASITQEERQIRALQMLVSMMNLGTSVEDVIEKIEKSYSDDKTYSAEKSLLTERVTQQNLGELTDTSGIQENQFQTVEIMLPTTALFPSGSHELTTSAQTRLQALARELAQMTRLVEVEIVGHTDGRVLSAQSRYHDNFSLSSIRAGAVASTLIKFGVESQKISVRGMGSLKPLMPENNADGKPNLENMAKNRRVVILLKLRRAHGSTNP